ncbi:MAG: EpsG family protein [Lachnospiraceae bacterium]|nr:EpsG family protein [Lachnospiraceae bacterium]
MIYVIIGVYTVIASLFYRKYINIELKVKKSLSKIKLKIIQRYIVFCIAFLPCILLSGLRYGIANDYVKIYERGFYEIANDNIVYTHFEVGFTWLVKICSKFVHDPWFMFLLVSAITITTFVKSFEKSESFILSIILFFAQGMYFDSFNGIRQYIVIAIFLYSFRYIQENNLKKYMITMLIASLFHSSALITFPLFFFRKVKLNYIVFIITVGVLFVLKDRVFNIFLSLMTLLPKSNSYIEKGTYLNYISTNLYGLIISISVLVLYLYVYRKITEQEAGIFQINMAYLGLIFAVCSTFLPLMDRFLYFTKAYYLLSVPYALSLIKSTKNRIFIATLYVIFILGINIYGIVFNDWYGILPYKSIFTY